MLSSLSMAQGHSVCEKEREHVCWFTHQLNGRWSMVGQDVRGMLTQSCMVLSKQQLSLHGLQE